MKMPSSKSVAKGIAAGIAVGTTTMLLTNKINKKSSAIKKNAGKAVSAIGGIISAMQN